MEMAVHESMEMAVHESAEIVQSRAKVGVSDFRRHLILVFFSRWGPPS